MCLVDGRGCRRQEQSNDVITVCVKNLVDICSLLSSEMIRESTTVLRMIRKHYSIHETHRVPSAQSP